jgi:uncharacterized membrane protein YphA (DoxX/SURF4 family)
MHLAVSLVSLLALGFYLSPAMDLHWNVAGVLLGATMIVTAIGMATGWHTKRAAWLLIAAGPLGMLEFGIGPVIQRVDMLGPALFLLIAGPGRWSADHELNKAREPSQQDIERAVWALKVTVGAALIIVAFAEKLANPALAHGATELSGHLPVYGTMLVLLVYGSDPRLRPLVATLWPWRAARAAPQPA